LTKELSIARGRAGALTAKSETLKMTLNHADRTTTLTAEQKADIFRRALENMRDELDRNHVQFQSDEPEDATYLIEGLYRHLRGDDEGIHRPWHPGQRGVAGACR
jgi:hypothetical protein